MKSRKHLFLTLIILSIFSLTITAQTERKPVSLTLYGGLNEYIGDLGNGFFDFKQSNPMGAFSLGLYLSPSINFGLMAGFGDYGYKADKGDFDGLSFFSRKMDGSMFIEYKLNNGYILSREAKLSPFLSAGMGFAAYGNRMEQIEVFPLDFIVPLGAGLKYHFTDAFSLQYKYQLNLTNHDHHDYVRANRNNDMYGQHMIGLTLSFGGKKKVAPVEEEQFIDSDGDGVPDHLDRCPNTPRGVAVDKHGCPIDSDGDGVPDYLDKCPDTPKGVAVDKDGCPIDSDGDGVPDYLDKCPDIPGPAWNDGCPEEVTEMIDLLGKIQFEFDSQVIKVESFPMLDNAYDVLKANPEYVLIVEGHTDNIGTDEYNQDLSERRANAVFMYLTLKGIESSRVKASGFGSKKPVADNSTAEGRAKNRRIEFRVTL